MLPVLKRPVANTCPAAVGYGSASQRVLPLSTSPFGAICEALKKIALRLLQLKPSCAVRSQLLLSA